MMSAIMPRGTSPGCQANVSITAKVRAVHPETSGSLSSVRNGGEGWGEEALRHGDTVRMGGAPLSPTLSPLVPRGARETDALLVAAISARTFATIDNKAVGPEGIGVVPVAADALHLTLDPSPHPMRRGRARDFAQAALQLAAVPRRVFAHRSGGEDELVAKGGRDGAARFQQGFKMQLGGLLKAENGLAAILSVRVAARQQSGLGNPHRILVATHLNLGNGNDHRGDSVACGATDVKAHA